ncbi:MAG: efflux RND transporter periplasmic adaptor subunit [Planctomycetota bacterium]|jgi:multidrug resistance efflux pump|nr:efflux RND transporter periplasmic adaptor subunit [Planctomycetota bacterium]
MSADAGFELLARAGRAGSRDELAFFMTNRSVAAVRYDRAVLWRLARRPRPVAASGAAPVDPRSACATEWAARLLSLPDRSAKAVFAGAGGGAGGSALWIPMPGAGCGMTFERFAGGEFTDVETAVLEKLVAGYGAVWRGLGKDKPRGSRRRLVPPAVLILIVLVLVFVRVPLRIVATCEVAARAPALVAAPMDGVIREVTVAPGQRVEAGEALAEYDSRLMEEEMNIALRQVGVVEAELAAARARAFSEPAYRGEAMLLESRLEREMARRDALEIRYSRRRVTAPASGVVQLDDARGWRGRPVSTGQGIMWIVDPADTRVAIWLPQDDRIDIDLSRPAEVHLFALGGEGIPVRITYVSSFASPSPDGVYAFPAEAEWLDDSTRPALGLRGVASVYGDTVSLGHWLFRRPMAWARRWLGV